MKLRFNILSPSNTGSPDYDICGQAVPVLNNIGLSISIILNGVNVFSESNLGGAWFIPVVPAAIGSKTMTSFSYSSVNGFVIGIQSNATINVEDTLEIKITKAGYQTYHNTIKLFDYDLGDGTLPANTNPLLNFYLVANANNIDVNGNQTKAFSKFTAYRKPFTNELYYFNLVGTQGSITYSDISNVSPIILSTGQNGVVCADTGMTIRQSISVENVYNTVVDTCTTELTKPFLNWYPKVNVSVNCFPACDDECVSNIATGTYTTIVDTNNLDCIRVDDVSIYPYHNIPSANVLHTFYDYQGIAIVNGGFSLNVPLNLCGDLGLISVQSIPALPLLGDVIIKTDFIVMVDEDDVNNYFFKCTQTTTIKRCNWYSITETDTCGIYTVSNCSVDESLLTIKQLQDDKTFLTILTVVLPPLSNNTIELITDGVHAFEVPSKTVGETDTLIVVNDCALEACLFSKLGGLICNTHKDDCIANIKQYYDFNALVLNAHTYYALLNAEFNFNYIYKSLGVDKLNDLYSIKQYLDNLAAYCVTPCDTCNCSS